MKYMTIEIKDSVIIDSTIVNLSEEIKSLRKIMVVSTALSMSRFSFSGESLQKFVNLINETLGFEDDD